MRFDPKSWLQHDQKGTIQNTVGGNFSRFHLDIYLSMFAQLYSEIRLLTVL